jgi:hypothetical protein
MPTMNTAVGHMQVSGDLREQPGQHEAVHAKGERADR